MGPTPPNIFNPLPPRKPKPCLPRTNVFQDHHPQTPQDSPSPCTPPPHTSLPRPHLLALLGPLHSPWGSLPPWGPHPAHLPAGARPVGPFPCKAPMPPTSLCSEIKGDLNAFQESSVANPTWPSCLFDQSRGDCFPHRRGAASSSSFELWELDTAPPLGPLCLQQEKRPGVGVPEPATVQEACLRLHWSHSLGLPPKNGE